VEVHAVENHKLCFDITQVLSVVDFFQKKWDHTIIWIHVFSNTRKHIFYSEFYVHLLCEFSVMLDYDEMNCNIVFGVFYNVF
jgi:hypothetical protein